MTTIGSKYRGTKEFLRVYMKLIAAAQQRGTISYLDVAEVLGIEQPGHHMARQVGQVLGEISEDEHDSGRPMLSAVAVATTGYPGDGFFNLASGFGKYAGSTTRDKKQFWTRELDHVYSEWSGTD